MPYKRSERGQRLTDTELRILGLFADGNKDAEIARMCFLAESSIHNYSVSIYRKLGARNRAHAVAIGFRTKLLR